MVAGKTVIFVNISRAAWQAFHTVFAEAPLRIVSVNPDAAKPSGAHCFVTTKVCPNRPSPRTAFALTFSWSRVARSSVSKRALMRSGPRISPEAPPAPSLSPVLSCSAARRLQIFANAQDTLTRTPRLSSLDRSHNARHAGSINLTFSSSRPSNNARRPIARNDAPRTAVTRSPASCNNAFRSDARPSAPRTTHPAAWRSAKHSHACTRTADAVSCSARTTCIRSTSPHSS